MLMKLAFLLISIGLFGIASAQDYRYPGPFKKKYQPPFVYKLSPSKSPRLQSIPFATNSIPFILPNGNKVISLPQDNMPCIIPDMTQFNTPNMAVPVYPYKQKGPGAIPNPVNNVTTIAYVTPVRSK